MARFHLANEPFLWRVAIKVYVEISRTGRLHLAGFSAYVHRLEDAGATGVCLSDHLFTADGSARPGGVQPDADPFMSWPAWQVYPEPRATNDGR